MAIEKDEDYANDPIKSHEHWSEELKDSDKFLEEWYENAEKIYSLFLPKKGKQKVKYNLFNSNIGILKTALFSRIPKPTVKRRFDDSDDVIGRVASNILERVLTFELNQNGNFKRAVSNMITDYLVVGAGFGISRYDATVSDPVMLGDDVEHELAEGDNPSPVITNQNTDIEFISYKDIRWQPSRVFDECRWMARRVYVCEDDFIARFGQEKANLIAFTVSNDENDEETVDSDSAEVWEIYDADTRKIYYFNESAGEILDIKDDFLQLPGFFPFNTPLFANSTPNALIPVSDFELLESQYKALEETNNRINRLIRACRLAGVYDASSTELKGLLETSGDTVLIPVKNYDAFETKGGLAQAISFLPLTEIVTVIQQLLGAKAEIANQIEQLSGISDIARGVSAGQYESAASSSLRAQAVNVRLSSKQDALATAVTDLIKHRAHLICRFYTDEQIIKRMGVINQADAEYVMPALQLLRDELTMHFMVEISSDSLSSPSFGADSQTKALLLQQINGFVPQILDGMQQMPELGNFYLQMLKWSIQGTKGASDLEGIIDVSMRSIIAQAQAAADQQRQAQAQQQQQPDTATLQLQLQQQQAEANNQFRMQELQMAQEKQTQDFQLKMAEMDMKKLQMQIDTTSTQAELQMKQTELELSERDSGEKIKLENRKLELAEEQFLMSLQEKHIQPPAEMSETNEPVSEPNPKLVIKIGSAPEDLSPVGQNILAGPPII